MSKGIFLLFIIGGVANSYAQTKGAEELFYPKEAIENRIQGKILLRFMALPSGEIVDSTVQVIQGLGYGLDKIAIETIRKAPPLSRNYVTRLRKDTLSEYILPIIFSITPKDWGNYYYLKGQEEQVADNHTQAIRYFLLAIDFMEKKAPYYFSLYQSYIELRSKEDACKYLKKAKKLNDIYKKEWVDQCK